MKIVFENNITLEELEKFTNSRTVEYIKNNGDGTITVFVEDPERRPK
jgi:hypothetical protein